MSCFFNISCCTSHLNSCDNCVFVLRGGLVGTAKVWILWVPVIEQKDEIGYNDRSSELSAQVEKKTPTCKQMQELKEQMVENSWDEDENLFEMSGSSQLATSMLNSMLGNGPEQGSGPVAASMHSGSGPGNNKRKPASGISTAKAKAAVTRSWPNMAIEAAKHKKNTVKDCPGGLGGGPGQCISSL